MILKQLMICKKIKLEHYLSPYAKINSRKCKLLGTRSRLVVACWGRGGKEGRIIKIHKATLRDRCVQYFDCDDGFTGIYLLKY